MFQPLSGPFSRVLLAIGLSLAFIPAFATDFPTGTYMVEGNKPAMSFDGKGGFRVTEGEKLLVAGKYLVKGDQIKLTDTQGPWACTKDGTQTGTYSWSVQNAVLTLSKVTDACEDRVGSLAGVKWKQTH